MQEKVFNKGDVIVRQDDIGDSFFRIEEGACEVFAKARGGEDEKLTDLGAGQFFGELAVLETYPRSATVIASEDGTRVTEIPESDINDFFTKDPEMIIALFRHISGRLRSLTADYKEAAETLKQLEGGEETEDKEGLLRRIGKAISGLFVHHDEIEISAETERVLDGADYTKGYCTDTYKYPAGTVIFREGEPGRCMYTIHWGKIGIYADYGTDKQRLLTELLPGQFFGEMGMIENEPRSATAVALEDDTMIEVITPDGMKELFKQNPGKVDLILRALSYRLRKLTMEYTSVCKKIQAAQNA